MSKLAVFRCYYCDRLLSRSKKTRDHVTPRSRNGSNAARNIVDACKPCNNLKGCLDLNEFRVVIAFRLGFIDSPEFQFPGEIRKQQTHE